MSDDAFRRLALFAIVIVGVLLYVNTLAFREINFDGIMFLLHNPLLKDLDYYAKLHNIYEFSLLDEQLGLNSDVTTSFMLRPLAYLTFSFNYFISGLNPVGFRAVNIAIHIVNSLLVFACIRLLLSSSPYGGKLGKYSTRFIPAASAFVFLLHPMQTGSVTYIMQRFASLAALFYLAVIWSYLVWVQHKQKNIKHDYARWGSVVVLFLGMFVRESLFTAPLMIVLLEMTVLGNCLKTALKRAAPYLVLLPVIPVMVTLVSAAQNNSSTSIAGAFNVVNYEGFSAVNYALTQMVVVLTYLRLYLFPYGQNLDHDQTLYTHFYQLPVLGSALIIVFLVWGSLFLYRKNREDVRCMLVFVGVCWFFLALSVSSSFIPQSELIAEHRAYFASAGIIMALIGLMDIVRTALGTARINGLFVGWMMVWCVALMVLTYKRNNMWESGISLWSDAVRKSPAKQRPWYNLGIAYFRAGNYPETLKCLSRTLELGSDFDEAYEVLAIVYLKLNRYQEVAETSLRGINVNPANPVHYNHLGIAYTRMGRGEEAKQAFTTAINLRPGYENALQNKAEIESYMESSAGKMR
jgi:tetratricopeptide (TPR) repeat protein